MKKNISVLLLSFCFIAAKSQSTNDETKNVVISKSRKEFKFIKGNTKNPVQIVQESRLTYTCNSFRTDIPIVEFYNDVETIDNLDIYVNDSKKHGIVPKYEYYNINGVFYSDAHVCYFSLPLPKKGSTSQVNLKKTTLDPHYFTSIYFMEDQPVEDQEIKLTVPSWMEIEVKEFNFKNYQIQKKINKNGDNTEYIYTMKDIPAINTESSAPGPTYYIPHILVLCKSAQPKDEKYVYFKTLAEQYAWYKSLVLKIGNDEKIVKEKTNEIVKGISRDEEKVKVIFQWVQDNIRYIAFENGIAGFKPEPAQEVMRKKYGDCKGMANLLTEMLKSINLDARKCWLGTNHIAYDYSTPSLSVDNHMICAWMNKGKPVYLDATEKYIGFGEIAERIQNRQTLIENGNQYLLERVPKAGYLQNTATEIRTFSIKDNNLQGHIIQVWKGESKEWLLTALNDIKMDKQENALKQYLAKGLPNFEITNLKIENLSNYNADLKVDYDVLWKGVISVFDKESYLDIDNRRNLENFKIDTSKRKLPYWFSFKRDLVFETEVVLPDGKSVTTLPENLTIKQAGYTFMASYKKTENKVIYKNEIILSDTELKPEQFSQWNKDIDQLTNFYNQQIVLTQKN